VELQRIQEMRYCQSEADGENQCDLIRRRKDQRKGEKEEFWLRLYLVVLGLQGATQTVLGLQGATQMVLSLHRATQSYAAGTQSMEWNKTQKIEKH